MPLKRRYRQTDSTQGTVLRRAEFSAIVLVVDDDCLSLVMLAEGLFCRNRSRIMGRQATIII
jgi:hypothetical protein